MELGYSLSSEEFGPRELLDYARRAEAVGFPFALISDHFHPWIDRQGQSPFVWNVVGAIAASTERLRLGTGVTCPTMRMHPALVAQAAATAAAMMPGRFFLGLGSGENLNEHITGGRWPSADERLDMLEEAIAVIRLLWRGGTQTHRGRYFSVDHARLYTLPEQLPAILIAAVHAQSAELAGRLGDGLISTAPDGKVVQAFRDAGGAGKPCYGQLTVCWARNEDEALRTAQEIWPSGALPGALNSELPSPAHFESAAKLVKPDDIRQSVVCGPDAQRHRDAVQEFADAGFEYVYVHQVGPDQRGFFEFYAQHVLPHFGGQRRAA